MKKLKCNYCKEAVKEQVESNDPTWFGSYKGCELEAVICKDCLPKNREKWRKREFC